MVKPEKELRAFAKTRLLAPGESETVKMVVKKSDLSSFDESSSCWQVETGKYRALWGTSSTDIRLQKKFDVKDEIKGPEMHRVLLPKRELNELKK